MDTFGPAQKVGHQATVGMLVAGLISAVLGSQLPGPSSIYLGQDLSFVAPVKIGDTVKVVVTVTEKRDDKRIIKLHTTVCNQRGEMVIDGTAADVAQAAERAIVPAGCDLRPWASTSADGTVARN